MYLHNPSIEELQVLDLPLLIEMLSHQTEEYLSLLNQEGYTDRTRASREALLNIQVVIQSKESAERRSARKNDPLSQSPNPLPGNNRQKS